VDKASDAELGAGIELEGIGEIGVEPAPDHFELLQPRDGAHVERIVAHGEIGALGQQEAEISGEEGMLEIGLVERPGGEHRDARIGRRRKRGELRAQALEEAGEALDRQGPVDFGQRARHGEAVLQRIARARRRLRPVTEHPPAPVRAAADVDGVVEEVGAAARLDADHGPEEVGRAGEGRGRQEPVADEIAGTEQVAQHHVEQFGALGEPGRQARPFLRRDDEGDMGQRPGALAVLRVVVDAVEHAGVAQVALGAGKALVELARADIGEAGEDRLPVLARLAALVEDLVIDAGDGFVARQHRQDALAAVVGGALAFRGHAILNAPAGGAGRASPGTRRCAPAAAGRPGPAYGRGPGSARAGVPPPRRS
jgi:hypothetical protein